MCGAWVPSGERGSLGAFESVYAISRYCNIVYGFNSFIDYYRVVFVWA